MTYEEAFLEAKRCEGTGTPMPQYRSHKTVWALKIREVIHAPLPTIAELEAFIKAINPEVYSAGGYIVPGPAGSYIVPEEGGFAPFVVSVEYMQKHKPQPGGYFVQYQDGYKSFSPAQAFEEGYMQI
jgi:hypothetical protein